jgi:hypothetical protein
MSDRDRDRNRDRGGITPADIEAKFREIQGQFDTVAAGSKRTLVAAAAAGGVVLLLVVYVLGRRAGRKRSTVLEIRRI